MHWYTKTGEPCYEIRAKNGSMRPTTLRDARKLGLVPSVTTVLSVIAKPQLEVWKVKQGILAALTLERNPDESDESFIARVLRDSQEQARQAADEGTRIHDAIECYYKGRAVPAQYLPHVEAVKGEIARLFPHVDDWIAERSFSHPQGFGGKVDLHSPSTGIVIDFKGKDGDFSDGKRIAYDQHLQLSAYRVGLGFGLREAVCANVFVSRTHPGAVTSHVWSSDDMRDGLDVFEAALSLWKCINRYDSSQAY